MTDIQPYIESPIAEKPPSFKPAPIGEWRVMISFGKSSSANFARALKLAKLAPEYAETEYDGDPVYQATYTADRKHYLAFIKLYELIKSWKSCNVFINGFIIDRKIIGSLNYCYGDRCRSTDKQFCYGASHMTKNPFGCHRLQISNCNHPWYSFYERQPNVLYKLNRASMKERIDSFAETYWLCPEFDYDRIMKVFWDFEDTLTVERAKELIGDNTPWLTVSFSLGDLSGAVWSEGMSQLEWYAVVLLICPVCGQTIKDESGVCEYCGTPIKSEYEYTPKDEWYECPRCLERIGAKENLCRACGLQMSIYEFKRQDIDKYPPPRKIGKREISWRELWK